MIPLVRSNSVEDINTSLIATRREIENGGSGSGSSMSNGNMNVNVNVIYDIIDEVKAGSGLPITSNAVAESLSYSTTEQKTGGKWIDGKMIYRKVLTGTSIPSGNYIGEISNFDTVIKADGWIKDASLGNWLPVGYGVVNNNTSNPQLRVDYDSRVYFAVANYSVLKYVVTLEYTKN